MDRLKAYRLVCDRIAEKNLIKHIISVEAVMRRLAEHFDVNVERWGLVGLLHDLDYVETVKAPERHTYLTKEWLKEYPEIDDEMIYAIHCHAGHAECRSRMDWALYAADPATGLVVAAVLTHPSRKIVELPLTSLLKRFKEKRFAAGASREAIASCDKAGLSLEQFLGLSLEAMQGIASELEL